jgi:hypothetical protein
VTSQSCGATDQVGSSLCHPPLEVGRHARGLLGKAPAVAIAASGIAVSISGDKKSPLELRRPGGRLDRDFVGICRFDLLPIECRSR